MPNVNYRGKPSQDPNVPPESGVTSIPLGAPWPPLSREQVVKLHEALVAFRREMEASKGIRSHEDQQDMIWGAAVELDGLLVEMGIGSPPPKRTRTHEEVAKVAEEVQQDRFGHITDLSRHSKPREEPTTDEDSGPGAMSWQQAEEFGSPFAAAVEPAWLRLDWGSVQMPVRNLSGQDLAEGQIVTTGQVQVEPPKRNCWTCKHSLGERGGWLCNTHNIEVLLWLGKPENNIGLREDGRMMPERTTDGCPGWKPKNETAKRECWTCGSFHINNGCGKKWTASTALAAHLKKMDDLIDGGSSPVDVASMDLNCPGWERKPSDAVASLERWMKGGTL